MRNFDAADQAAQTLTDQFWGFYDRVDRCWMSKVEQPKRGPLRLKARGCALIVPDGPGVTPERLVAQFVIDHGDCMIGTIQAVIDDPLARDPRCQCLAPRKRRAA